LDEADANIGYQYDVYHMQRMEGELAKTISRHMDRIAYIQIADSPNRHEPGTGEVNFDFLLPYIEGLGYDGWIGCEYRPLEGTEEGLGWIERFGHRCAPRTAGLATGA
ncbi:MAG: TIM barrel protein, partial [Rhodospirillales bacterium]|nr:TIM barrel protein [Rhodospirillales bacterium]